MEQIAMRTLKAHRYDGTQYEPGDRFEANARHARGLEALGRAEAIANAVVVATPIAVEKPAVVRIARAQPRIENRRQKRAKRNNTKQRDI